MQNNKTLNVGAGQKQIPGATNIDIIPFPGLDWVGDITNGLPYGQCEFDSVVADYVLCQIADREKFKFVMNEIWRVLKPGGEFHFKVPNAAYPVAFNDPMDCRYFTKDTFDYFNKDHYRWQAFNYGFKPWEIVSVEPERTDRFQVIMRKPNGEI